MSRLSILTMMSFLLLPLAVSWAGPDSEKIRAVYEKTSGAVFYIQSGGGHGTGFLVDEGGLVVTNSHVVGDAPEISVRIDPSTRVPAVVVENDTMADIAILAVNPEAVEHIAPLQLSAAESAQYALIGETVIAIGFPLNQGRTLTHGVVSNVEDNAIISDVNINPGNSGGPLLTLFAEVVGVNTFGDEGPYGPGISGIVAASEVVPVLERAKVSRFTMPPFELLPVTPSPAYPLGGRELMASIEAESSHYLGVQQCEDEEIPRWMSGKQRMMLKRMGSRYLRRFVIYVNTPVSVYRPKYQREQRKSARRDHRARSVGKSAESLNDETFVLDKVEWSKHAGDTRDPVVWVVAAPVLESTSASTASTFLYGTPTQALTWKADVYDLDLFKTDEPLPEILKAVPRIDLTNYAGIPIVGEANFGMLVMSAEYFEPDFTAEDSPSELILKIDDVRHPQNECFYVLKRAVLERVWADFESYRDFLEGRSVELALPRAVGR